LGGDSDTIMPSYVTVSRHWDNPQILSNITIEGIAIGMEIKDFTKALKIEMGLTDDAMDKAVVRVLEKMKEESTKIVAMARRRRKKG